MKRVSIRSVAISCFLFAAPSFAAADKALCSSDDGSLVVFGDIGVANIKAQEFFYAGDHEISQLNWESKGVTLFQGWCRRTDRQQLELEGQRQSQHRRQWSPG
ncbi:peptidase (plasmid) [Sinorhizobium meliloti]|nr:peptidase [Sinorhizobium meliloti]